jgi:S-DNA-T family DNA segregation ATPase FtsK/SpoIIIE
MNRSRQSHAWREIGGLALLGAGALLFLSLISYDVGDIPSWAPLISSTSTPNESTQNLVGVLGALCGGYAYFFFGVASFWLAVLMAGLGLALLLIREFAILEQSGWALLNVIAAACLVQLWPGWFPNYQDYFLAHGTGGFIGYWLGRRALGQLLGPAGSVVVLLVLYLASLILVTGFHPIRFCRSLWEMFTKWRKESREQRLANLDDAELLAEKERELRKKTEKLEKKLRKKSPTAADELDSGSAGPKRDLPPPKIIDASVPTPKPEEKDGKGAPHSKKQTSGKISADALSPLAQYHVENYSLPDLDLLDEHDTHGVQPADPAELRAVQDTIIDTLKQFAIEAEPGDITKGPTITRYEIYPAKGIRVDRISALERDIARATKAERINILAPIPGKDTVGIELANSKKVKVILRELFESDAWVNTKARLPIALGKDVYGQTIIGDLAQMPHCLVAGTTGSGKSVCINAIIASLLFRHTPEELRFIMIDPKVVELQMFNSLPHLVTPVVTDPKKVLLALRWVIDEMELRYKIFAKSQVRNIAGFNSRPLPKTQAELNAERSEKDRADELAADERINDAGVPASDPDVPVNPESAEEPLLPVSVRRDDQLLIPDRMPYIVVIVDELADLMQTAPADVEGAIARITQMARAAGIHMIVATQTPRADVVTGIIKANIPTRIAFQVASKIDSRVILDENGAERLLGQGDMLYQPPGTSKLTRAQGVLVTDEEMKRVVDFVSAQSEPSFEASIHEKLTSETGPEEDVTDEDEELVDRCLEIIKQERKASTSMLQRRLRLGYTRAARVVDILEQRGILGPKDGAKDREILIDLDTL